MITEPAPPEVLQPNGSEPAPSVEIARDDSRSWGQRIAGGINGYLELRKTRYGMTPILIITGLSFFGAFEAQAFLVTGPNVAQDLHINLNEIIGIIQVIQIIGIFAALYAGWWADRHKRAPMYAFGWLLSTVFDAVSSRSRNEGDLGVTRSLGTAAGTIADVPSFSLLADYYPPDARGRAFGFAQSFIAAAGLMAAASVGFYVEKVGWRTSQLTLALPLIVMSLIAIATLKEPIRGYFERRERGLTEDESAHEDEPLSIGEAFRATFAVRTVRRFLVADIVYYIGASAFAILTPFYFADYYGLGAQGRSLLSIPGLLAVILGGFTAGALTDYFSRRSPTSILRVTGGIGLVCVLIGNVVFAAGLPIWAVVASSFIANFGLGFIAPIRFALISQVIPPAIRTQGLQVLGLSLVPGIIAAGPITALVTSYGYSAALLTCIPFMVLGLLLRISAADFFDTDRRNAFKAAAAGEEWKEVQAKGSPKVLVCRGVEVHYGGTQVLFGVDFDVEEGEIVALLGTNGAGKSTLLRAISGTSEASGGAIIFDGRDITHMPPNEVAARGVIHMPGGRGVFADMTVGDNLQLSNWMFVGATDTKERFDRIYEIFPVLKERIGEKASALSGGEQQMLSLSMAFLSRPKILMIDELSLGLSPAVVGQLLEIVRQIHAQGTTLIIVEQSVNVALTIAHRAVFMEKGEIKFMGPTAELMRRPDILRSVYVKGSAGIGGGQAVASESDRARRRSQLDAAPAVLEVVGIRKSFGGILALDDVSFSMKQGEVLGIIGPNGSGKTTLFDIISGYQDADRGQIRYEGVDITNLAAHERARRKLIRRFQDARLFPQLTVYETLLVALDQRLETKSVLLGALGVPRARRAEKRARVRADKLIELLALESYADKFVRELSTGLRRIVDLAFVLAAEPKVLLLDEPSSGIAQAESEGLAALLRRIRFETGCSLLIIEHDMPLISSVSDELIALDRGELLLRGSPETVLNDPRVIESYLGGSEAAVRRSGSLA